ncbi:response regulator [Patescibacteria group bacterium]|nr:response regulator [Patescibacteria group bacterium]
MKTKSAIFIDDEPLILEIYKKEFEKHGYKVYTTTKAAKGLELIKKHQPNIAFIDIIMPTMDGFSLLKRINSNPKLQSTALIVLTNIDSPDARRKCSQLGCVYFLVKPLHEPKDVVKLANQVIAAQKTVKK